MEVKETIEDAVYQYSLHKEDKILAYIKGRLLTERITLSLFEFNTTNQQQEKEYAHKIGKKFFEDCKKNDSTIVVTLTDRTKKTVWFLQQNNFTHTFTKYVFENNLEDLKMPAHTFKLKPFSEVDVVVYQKAYFECSKGDPEVDLEGLTYQTHYQKDKNEIGDLWDDNLAHMVYLENIPIGVLNLRTETHQKTSILEGSINYIGLLPTYRNRGLGKALHLTGLHQLKALGCKNYFGGTTSNNQAMLKTFKTNNCHKTQTQNFYKALN